MRFKMEKQEQLVITESQYCVPFVKWRANNADEAWVTKLKKTLKWNNVKMQKPLHRVAKL
jgi:hypothetical protein